MSLIFTFTYAVDDRSILIDAKNKKNEKYHLQLFNFDNCQKPEPLLTSTACRKKILHKLETYDFKYYVNETLSELKLHMSILEELHIELILIRKEEEGEDELDKLKHNVSVILDDLAELVQYEKVHEFKYPTWNGLNEFKSLPDFKYFEASNNIDKYCTIIPDDKRNGYLQQYPGNSVSESSLLPHVFIDGNKEIRIFEMKTATHLGGTHILYINNWIKAIFNKYCVDYAEHSKVPFGCYRNSVHDAMLIRGYGLILDAHIGQYITDYVTGWYLLNIKLVVHKAPMIHIIIDNTDVYVKIYARKLGLMSCIPKNVTNIINHSASTVPYSSDIKQYVFVKAPVIEKIIYNGTQICRHEFWSI